jgi:hypothetical protein
MNSDSGQPLLGVVQRFGEDDDKHDDRRQKKEPADHCRPYEVSDRFHG